MDVVLEEMLSCAELDELMQPGIHMSSMDDDPDARRLKINTAKEEVMFDAVFPSEKAANYFIDSLKVIFDQYY
jgi:phage anti-repressor protein